METTTFILKTIANEINNNPLWALLRAREYLNKAHPLFKAYACKARKACENLSYPALSKSQIETILRGEGLANLEELKPFIRPRLQEAPKQVVGGEFFADRGNRLQALPSIRRSSRSVSLAVKGRGGYTRGNKKKSRTRTVAAISLARGR